MRQKIYILFTPYYRIIKKKKKKKKTPCKGGVVWVRGNGGDVVLKRCEVF